MYSLAQMPLENYRDLVRNKKFSWLLETSETE